MPHVSEQQGVAGCKYNSSKTAGRVERYMLHPGVCLYGVHSCGMSPCSAGTNRHGQGPPKIAECFDHTTLWLAGLNLHEYDCNQSKETQL